MNLRVCEACKTFNHPLNIRTCLQCQSLLVFPDAVHLEFAIQDRVERRLLGMVVLLVVAALVIAGTITWFLDGSFYTQRNASAAPTLWGSNFFELGFGVWICLLLCCVGVVKAPNPKKREAVLRYAGYRSL